MNWITKNYPKGARITVPSQEDPKATISATVINHYTGANGVEGIVVRDDNGNTYDIHSSFLDEDGGGV